MDTQSHQPNPPIDLPAQAYRHLIHTLIALLPPPVTDTPEATLVRNHAAIARIAALAPVNANEAELAAQCIAARAQAEDVLRLIRLHADDIKLVIKLNAQYAAMVRTSLAAHGHLLREQQQRRKREATQSAADTDEWTRHIAANTMLHALPTEPEAQPAPETDPESHVVENETTMRRPTNRVIDLRPTPPRTLNQGVKDGNSVTPDRVRLSH
ncbi:MAG TPA: hypothetical protein DDZ81_08815 [Acetobacteraceae bacterium]|nr:hypothetical protein [Acetobacteraceae bacterium]